MRIHDSILGGILILLAAGMWFASDSLPNPTMQPYGPGFFPKIVAALLGFAALTLVVKGLAASAPLIEFDDWAHSPMAVFRVILVPVGILLFSVAVDSIGFIPCGIVMLWAMLIADGQGWLRGLLVATTIMLVTHSIFYLGFHVQLPWGLLQPVRW